MHHEAFAAGSALRHLNQPKVVSCRRAFKECPVSQLYEPADQSFAFSELDPDDGQRQTSDCVANWFLENSIPQRIDLIETIEYLLVMGDDNDRRSALHRDFPQHVHDGTGSLRI